MSSENEPSNETTPAMSGENDPSNGSGKSKELYTRSTLILPPVLRNRANIHSDPDLTLHSRNGISMRVHKLLMFCISPYFEKCFRYASPVNGKFGPTLYIQADFGSMRAIVDYAYTGHLALTTDNVQSIREAADYYSIENMVRICDNYIADTQSTEKLEQVSSEN